MRIIPDADKYFHDYGLEQNDPREKDISDWWQQTTGFDATRTPRFVVGLPVYNEASTLPELWSDSIQRWFVPESLPFPVTVVIVSNGSTDGTPAVVRGIQTEYAESQLGGSGTSEATWRREGKFLTVKSTADLPGQIQIVHLHTSVLGKNNALNIIRGVMDKKWWVKSTFCGLMIKDSPLILSSMYKKSVQSARNSH